MKNFLEERVKKFIKEENKYDFELMIHSSQLRHWCCRNISYAIPSTKALEKILEFSPIIEIGSGRGYWARLLEGMGCDIICLDNKAQFESWFLKDEKIPIVDQPKEFEDINVPKFFKEPIFENYISVLKNNKKRNLFLCWPPYKEDLAFNSLKNFKGEYVIYIGEAYGGCTGCDNFHELLEKKFDKVDVILIPQWPMIHDRMYIYKRKEFDFNTK